MKNFLQILKKIFSPPIALLIFLNIASVVLLCFVFIKGYDTSIIAYVSYVLSAYTLTADIVNFIPIINKIKQFKEDNKYLKKYFSDSALRATMSLYISLFINIAYAVFNFIISYLNKSYWFAAVGVYYFLLSVLRFFLVRNSGRATQKLSFERRIYELKVYRGIGIMMFLVNIAMSGMAIQMIWQNKSTAHSEIMTIATAAFTFYCMIMAVINLQKYRKMETPILSAAKMLNFACALMSMFTMQSAMIASFDENNDNFRQIMNVITGSVVLLLVFGLAIYMIRRSNKLLKEIKDNNGEQ